MTEQPCPNCGSPGQPWYTPIKYMPMDTTLQNLLLRNGIESVEQLQKLSWGQLLTLRGVGEGKATRIRKALAMFKQ